MKVLKKFILFIICILLLNSCSNKVDAEKKYIYAIESYTKQDFINAMKFANLTIKSDSSFYQAHLLKAKIFYFDDLLDKSESILRKLVKKYPEYTDARIWYIRVLIAQKKYNEAEKYLIKELSFNSGDCRVFYQYGILCGELNRLDEQLSMYRKTENLLKDNSKVYIELANIWLLLDMPERALDELDKAELFSVDPQVIKQLKMYIKSGKNVL